MNKEYLDHLLIELYSYTQLEYDKIELTDEQRRRYVKIIGILKENNVEIPFDIEI